MLKLTAVARSTDARRRLSLPIAFEVLRRHPDRRGTRAGISLHRRHLLQVSAQRLLMFPASLEPLGYNADSSLVIIFFSATILSHVTKLDLLRLLLKQRQSPFNFFDVTFGQFLLQILTLLL